jgi:RimJ/RimL family protein N-acetyltransferase
MSHFMIPTLETERLYLRALREEDCDDYAALNADPEVMFHVSEPWDRGRSWRHLAFLLGHWMVRGTGVWAVEHRRTGAFVGVVGFFEPEGWPGFELAGRLARRWWGQGYAAESAQAALEHAFTVWNREHVISLVRPENRASIRLIERIGQTLRSRIEHNGREMLCYGIDRKIECGVDEGRRSTAGSRVGAPA